MRERQPVRERLPVARWALVSSMSAPVFLIGGWGLAQALQPAGYDAVHETISALARHGLEYRWVMTLGLAGLGLSHVVTAAGLRTLPPASRLLLAGAGVATAMVAVFAQPFRGTSVAHEAWATAGFVALALWPASTAARDAARVRRPAIAIPMSLVSAALLVWFATTLGAGAAGLSERVLTAQQALWPLAVVIGVLRAHRRGSGVDGAKIVP